MNYLVNKTIFVKWVSRIPAKMEANENLRLLSLDWLHFGVCTLYLGLELYVM